MLPSDDASEHNPEADSEVSPAQADAGKSKKLVKGLVFGIGSAALVAALLYASRTKSKKTPWR
jgi:hypothetical protein